MENSYYKNQLERIDTTSDYAPIVVISDAKGDKTKHLNINKESAQVLIEWLTDNYINKK